MTSLLIRCYLKYVFTNDFNDDKSSFKYAG